MEVVDRSGQPVTDEELDEALEAVETILAKQSLVIPLFTINGVAIRRALIELKQRRKSDNKRGEGSQGEEPVKALTPLVSASMWSYIINENGNAVRVTLEGHGSCTPVDVMQEFIDNLTPVEFMRWWNECERKKDVID